MSNISVSITAETSDLAAKVAIAKANLAELSATTRSLGKRHHSDEMRRHAALSWQGHSDRVQ